MSNGGVIAQRLTQGPRVTALDRWVLAQLHRRVGPAPLRFVLWDGSSMGPPDRPAAILTIRDRATLLGVAANADLYFGEAYMRGTLEVAADDLGDALTVLYEGLAVGAGAGEPTGRASWRARWAGAVGPSLRRARANVHHHYDLGTEFYRQWLDEDLVYTCAYYERDGLTLAEAQRAKMDLVCRKLRLQPGDRVVEAGCGWGALARHMARHYGVRVRAYNVSHQQIAHARDLTAREGLADRVEFVEADYRDIDGRADAFVSVGMLEHVGLGHYAGLGALMRRVLTRHGRGLLHFIGRNHAAPLNAWIRRRIFPGAYPPTLAEVCGQILEPQGFTVTDVENLRPHYARTLAAWRARFDAAAPEIARTFDETFVRAWRLYLAGSEAAFRVGSTELFQVAFVHPDAPVPWTRRALYASSASPGA